MATAMQSVTEAQRDPARIGNLLAQIKSAAIGLLRSLLRPPRIQALEFSDQKWLRGAWREAYLDGIDFLFRLGRVYKTLHLPYERWVAESGCSEVIALASGSAGPERTLLLSDRSLPKIVLSDLFPDVDAFRRIAARFPDRIVYRAESTDAASIRVDQRQLLSICTGFHHFSPPLAKSILANAVAHSGGIFIAEPFPRSWLSFLACIFNVPLLMLSPFFNRRISWLKVLITAVIPIIPVMLVCDGIISVLRIYRPQEILAMVPAEQRSQWSWRWGTQRYLGIFPVPWLYGTRKRKETTPVEREPISPC